MAMLVLYYYYSLLVSAIEYARIERIIELLDKRPELVQVVNRKGDTCVHLALRNTMYTIEVIIEMLELFISRGADPNAKNYVEETPLHLATLRHDIHLVNHLLLHGADMFEIDASGYTIFHYWMKNLLVKLTAYPQLEITGFSADTTDQAMILVENKTAKFAKHMSKLGFDMDSPSTSGCTPVHLAIDYNLQNLLPYLLKHTTDIHFTRTSDGDTLLHWFLKVSEVGALTNFIDPHDSAQIIKNTIGYEFSGRHSVESLSFCHLYEERIVKLLIDRGVSVDKKNHLGLTALHIVAEVDMRTDIVELLLKNGAEVNKHDINDNTAIVQAMLCNCVANVRELLAYGADINDNCVVSAVQLLYPTPRFHDARDLIMQHWARLKAAELPCSKEYENLVSYLDMQQLTTINNTEVQKLKDTFINGWTSLYQWLHMDPNRRFIHSRNENLRKIVESPTVWEEFPEYWMIICGCYRETKVRRALLDPATEAFYKLTNLHLPRLCVEEILSHINTGYMSELIEQASEE